jgi:hypothetical protein
MWVEPFLFHFLWAWAGQILLSLSCTTFPYPSFTHFYPGDGGSTFLQNVFNHSHVYTVFQPIGSQSKEIFLFAPKSRPALQPTQPVIHFVLRALSQGVKWPGPEADHSPPLRVRVCLYLVALRIGIVLKLRNNCTSGLHVVLHITEKRFNFIVTTKE